MDKRQNCIASLLLLSLGSAAVASAFAPLPIPRALRSDRVVVCRTTDEECHLRRLGCHRRRERTSHVFPLSVAPNRISSSQDVAGDDDDPASKIVKSLESNFWRAIPRDSSDEGSSRDGNREVKSSSSSPRTTTTPSLPAVPGLELETGMLPPGAYSNDAMCAITVGILPPPVGNGDGGGDGDDGTSGRDWDPWDTGARNAQKLIDSGFNSFCVRDYGDLDGDDGRRAVGTRVSKKWIALEKERRGRGVLRTKRRRDTELMFYRTLRQSTPPSVLRGCHFATLLDVPSVLSLGEGDPIDDGSSSVPFGNGWMVRESVGDALLRVGMDSLDSVVLNYREGSPYHLDVLNTLFEMKDEGLVRSVSVRNFPPRLLRSATDCGFGVQSNELRGNFLHPPIANAEASHPNGGGGGGDGCEFVASGALAGGLLTDQFTSLTNREWSKLFASERMRLEKLFDGNRSNASATSSTGKRAKKTAKMSPSQKWDDYRSITNMLTKIAFKHQTSIASVAMRWMLQSDETGVSRVIASTRLGTDRIEEKGGAPYGRYCDLRRVFTFALDDDDLVRLGAVAFGNFDGRDGSSRDGDSEIDFTNEDLWL